jgi:hypothetical protein
MAVNGNCVVWRQSDGSKEHSASIFMVKEYAKRETSRSERQTLLASFVAYSLTLKMVAIRPSETSHPLRTTERYNPEGGIVQL